MGPADLSVIVCTRERPELLRGALKTLLATVPDGVEIIVVDSASTTTATRQVADEAGVRYVRTDVKGLSIARNIGLAASDRAAVVYTDDDCNATTSWVEPLLAAFSDERVGIVTGTMQDHTLAGSEIDAVRVRYTDVRSGIDAGHGAIMAFRTSDLREIGAFDEVLGAGRYLAGAEDLDIFCRSLAAGHHIVHEPNSVINHIFTRENQAHRKLMLGYGLGAGAMVQKWVRLDRRVGLEMGATLSWRAARRAVRWTLSNPRRSRGSIAMLIGMQRGYRKARHMQMEGTCFVDEFPPTPIIAREHVAATQPEPSATEEFFASDAAPVPEPTEADR